jgi:hypothetical protein
MPISPTQLLTQALSQLLRPVIRIALRYGFAYNSFSELVKRLYVEVANTDFVEKGQKQTVVRASVLTGINRKDVKRINGLPPVNESGVDESFNRSVRVTSGWLRDKDFRDKKGDPDALPFDGVKNSFSELVRRYSGDMSARVLADELLRVEAIEYTRHGDLRLTSRGYIPGGGEVDKLKFLGTDVRDLIETIDHNMTHAAEQSRVQRKVAYINFPEKHLPKFRELNDELSQHMLEQLNKWLAAHDKPKSTDIKVRVGVGIYQFEEAPNDDKK